jgi:hypothetical protein
MGRKLDQWMVLTNIPGALPMPRNLCKKQTKSERVSDTVFFKTKYITQPTMTPEDAIIKALNNLTQALQGKSNAKGLEQIKALKKLEDILNNTPETAPIPIESPPPDTR